MSYYECGYFKENKTNDDNDAIYTLHKSDPYTVPTNMAMKPLDRDCDGEGLFRTRAKSGKLQ